MKTMTFGKLKESFDKLFKDKKTKWIVLAGIVGMVLILLSEVFSGPTASNATMDTPTFDNEAYNEAYIQKMQVDLVALISKIQGVGQVDVLVTLETGVQYVYATDNKTTQDSSEKANKSTEESSLIVIEGKNGKEPVVLKRIEPTIQGVLVVCQGAGNIEVKQAVIDAVTTLCGIKSNRVSVAKMTV